MPNTKRRVLSCMDGFGNEEEEEFAIRRVAMFWLILTGYARQ